MSEHTKTPFEVVETYGEMIDSDFQALVGNSVGAIAWVCDERYARHIVHCVNNHERLAEALRECASNPYSVSRKARSLLAALESEKGGG